MLQQIPSGEIIILGDFNANHTGWLGSRTTDHVKRSVHNFALSHGLSELVIPPTRITDVDDYLPSLLDLL